jgi:cytosine deaminase
MFDLLLRGATLPGGERGIDIGIENGRIAAVSPGLQGEAHEEIDVTGCLVTPPFVDAHMHMDYALRAGQPRPNETGTLLEGIALWGELRPDLTMQSIYEYAKKLCLWSIARGTLIIRSHVDICDDRLLGVQALTQLREDMKNWLDIQLVAFPQDGFLRAPNAQPNLMRALDMGVDVIGGIPHFERTYEDGTLSIRQLMRLAAEKGLQVDMHCDEVDDPNSRHVETLAAETVRFGLQGRVAGSHLTSMHSMDNYYVSKLVPLIAEAGLGAIANPLVNITLQGRHDTYPKRRGLLRVKELRQAGIAVAFGHDCVMDPWYGLGSHDMLEVASMGLHIAQMTGQNEMRACFQSVTTDAARILGLTHYEIRPGAEASLVVLQAADEAEAIRLRSERLYVIRRGAVIANAAPRKSRVMFDGNMYDVDFTRADIEQKIGKQLPS